ncbi:integrin beta-2-like [Protopterus annectens]|uniref:integrin beta-2-like n=1 Tax=Protopterus annectens TaxID=7888 RepID=UPI001CFBBE71|nr:integrin beta-2-like [Protopterus annectens]
MRGSLHLPVLIFFMVLHSGHCQECRNAKASNCNECIQAGPLCAWCKDPNFIKRSEPDHMRCDTVYQLENKGCKSNDTVYPKSWQEVKQNLTLSSTKDQVVQLTPQRIKLNLRPGQPENITVTFRHAQGFPIDLYYLMDLSFSMHDDLDNLKGLGQKILEALKDITDAAQIGFGTFVDKTVLPFVNTNPEILKNPCPGKNIPCQEPFGYKHVLSLTSNSSLFKAKVSSQKISGNLDAPEGGLDALMQATVCEHIIGWRNVTRLLLFATDDGFHIAGDGKLGSILTPNDGKCHMQNNYYTNSNVMDYPSVGHLALKLSEHNIQPIFAVTANMLKTYQSLSEIIPKSVVGELSLDSSNIVSLIKSAYNNLSSKVILEHKNLPDGIKVTYRSKCGTEFSKLAARGECDNVKINDTISFTVTVEATKCISPQAFTIHPLGFSEALTVEVETMCNCDCGDHNLNICNNGTFSCGICSCKEGFTGKNCTCNLGEKTTEELKASCRKDNSSSVCSGLGECECGVCNCFSSNIPGQRIYGKFCECDNTKCEMYNEKLCNGHGECDCGNCRCEAGYEGKACECKASYDGCMTARGTKCSGRGYCECNTCKCIANYETHLCESCPSCPSPCRTYAHCIECYYLNSTGNCENQCENITRITMADHLNGAVRCKEKDSQDCFMHFEMVMKDGIEQYDVILQKDRECPKRLSELQIALMTAGSVLLLGLFLLLFGKCLTELNDRAKYRRFEKEMKENSKWIGPENQLFLKATTTVANPMYDGD